PRQLVGEQRGEITGGGKVDQLRDRIGREVHPGDAVVRDVYRGRGGERREVPFQGVETIAGDDPGRSDVERTRHDGHAVIGRDLDRGRDGHALGLRHVDLQRGGDDVVAGRKCRGRRGQAGGDRRGDDVRGAAALVEDRDIDVVDPGVSVQVGGGHGV